ncbi:uncharacterized protein C1orf21 homolog isoform X2 [Antechinus flavipes]|uniref:Uncharacterized protein n=1 Tax=Sarcophilus harrisii TaxID=9305 RepID=A0A7N4V0H7_SARHA|nr:uncharacterized protein C1orf21 homolog [Sarcophilus harrisii]XP_031792884.1 uncharacterized protein C1orf21 homolog [Sarcophilus harrisii]XP_031792885.1 uncharacterized protein C1orf21 homolog [Sarcophilus harrisii]XP_051854749.1 uncharacterized protein C1orf21 homolog isoform X2 [Antechinus flavipes]
MGCASAKHVATVQNEEEAQKGKNYQNGDVFADEYRIKPVEEVKYMKNGAEDEQTIAARNQENLDLSPLITLSHVYSISTEDQDENCDFVSSWHEGDVDPVCQPYPTKEKSASANVKLKPAKEVPGLVHQPRSNMHISESQQEFFRMLDEKIEKGRDYCSEEEDIT